jgi:hypothetical protein
MSTVRTAFAIVPAWVIERVTNGTALRYYMHIACRYSNEKRHAFPSEETLAQDLGDTVRTAQRAIKALRDADALIVTRNRHGNGHLGGNRYWLPLDDPRDHTTNMTGGRDRYDQPEHNVSAGRNQPTEVAADQTTKMSVHEPDPKEEPDKPCVSDPQNGGLFEPPAPKPKPTRRRPETTAPDKFELTLALRGWFRDQGLDKLGININYETDQCLDWHRAKGSLHRDWDATWRRWMRTAGQRARERAGQEGVKRGRTGISATELPADDWRRWVQE